MTIAPFTLWLPNAFLITISGVGSLLLLDFFARQFTGLSLMVGLARGQILLAYCLLITDPMTSPRSNIGKVLYGIIYTFVLCAVYFLLILSFKSYSEYAKILAAPFVNILAPYLDDYCQKFKTFELKINNINFIKLRASILTVYIFGILFLYEKVLILYPAPYLMASYPKFSLNPMKVDYIPLFVEDLDKFNYPVWKSSNPIWDEYQKFFEHIRQ